MEQHYTFGENMAVIKQNPLRMIGEQIHAIMSVHPLSSAEQKQLTEARVIESYDGVPEIYQEFFRSHRSGGQAFPYSVLTPTYETSGGRITGKLICVIEHTLYVLEENETNVIKVCFPIDEINYVEVTHRPSDLSFKIDGVTNLGIPISSVFGCSNTTDSLFAPLFQRIRLRIDSLNEKAPSRHLERLDRWNDQQTKVMDMARHCLLAGETVIFAILQPEIRGGIFSNPECLTHTCILTDKELVMIREDLSQGRKNPCNTICNFIPLNKIESLSMSRENGNLLMVSTRLSNSEMFKSLFDISLENEVNQFLARTQELMPKKRWYVRD